MTTLYQEINHIHIYKQDETYYFSGYFDDETPSKYLEVVFSNIHSECLFKIKCIIDIKNIKYINSSSIKEFAKWIKNLYIPDLKQYLIDIHCDKSDNIQKTFINMIKLLSPEEIIIKEE